MKAVEGLSGRIKDGPVLGEDGKINPLRMTENVGLSREIRGEPALEEADGFESIGKKKKKKALLWNGHSHFAQTV